MIPRNRSPRRAPIFPCLLLAVAASACADDYAPLEPSALPGGSQAVSTATVIRLTSAEVDEISPAISGDRVVWIEEPEFLSGSLVLHDLGTGITRTLVAPRPIGDIDISGQRVAWTEVGPEGGSIHVYDVVADEERVLARNRYFLTRVSIDGGEVVWSENVLELPDSLVIIHYDLATGRETRVASHSAAQQNPDVSNGQVVWQDFRHARWFTGMGDVFAASVGGAAVRLTEEPVYSLGTWPSVWQGWVVWAGGPLDRRDIFLHRSATGLTRRLTSNPDVFESAPDIADRRVVWAESDAVVAVDLTSNRRTRIPSAPHPWSLPRVSGERVVWADRSAGNPDIYLLDLGVASGNFRQLLHHVAAAAAAGDIRNRGIATGLSARLIEAERELESGRPTAALAHLRSFMAMVQGLGGSQIASATAETLLEMAAEIRLQIGAGSSRAAIETLRSAAADRGEAPRPRSELLRERVLGEVR